MWGVPAAVAEARPAVPKWLGWPLGRAEGVGTERTVTAGGGGCTEQLPLCHLLPIEPPNATPTGGYGIMGWGMGCTAPFSNSAPLAGEDALERPYTAGGGGVTPLDTPPPSSPSNV